MLVIASWPAQVQSLRPVRYSGSYNEHPVYYVHKVRYVAIQYEPTGRTIYFQFIAIINLYMFRAGFLFIIRIPANSQST
jgi:hypothetical protein